METMTMKDVTQIEIQRATRGPARRWPWAVALLVGIAALAGAVVRNRGLTHRERPAIRLFDQPSPQYREQVASGRSPIGNGVIRADHPSGGTD